MRTSFPMRDSKSKLSNHEYTVYNLSDLEYDISVHFLNHS